MNQAFICYNVTAYEFGGRVEKVAKYPTYRTFFTHTVRLFIPLWFLTGPVFFATNQLSRGLNNVDSALSEVFIQRRVYSHIYTHDYCEYHSRVNFRRRNARLKDAQNRLTSWGLLHSHLDLLSFKNKKLKFSNKKLIKDLMKMKLVHRNTVFPVIQRYFQWRFQISWPGEMIYVS